ncbi:hypothetical protein BGZ80_003415 [Entomortierella chlamydospora]|uniref:Ubinuclein middle domain-containing protein n=1 Tax=Entomortierella chlamydospora TaxID=101097 RepID=A0A9P6N1Z1_9FUNG|nr:hypothetical protein BGZ79_003215 [Entomortierella chlamydospora]KAG0020883.1 hypothetical protein BGZ80_003415 [Entomortierella chlamydospora]
MAGPLLSSSPAASHNAINAALTASSSTSSKVKKEVTPGNTTVRIYYSLKENPNAIISYTDLIRQEQKRQRSSKNGGNGTSSATPSQSSSYPLKNSKTAGAGTSSKDAGQSSSTSMDIDPPEGEEALGDGDSEAEDDDEVDDDEDEEDAEAEDEDDDDDPDEDEDEDDDPDSGRREPKDFLDALTEKYGVEGNESEDDDEDEDDDGKGQVRKRPSRWDTERYDFEDDFIDDSEMMLESIGMVRPKVDGFFAYRGPVETTVEDADSSDAGPRSKKTSKRKPAAGSSPLSTSKSSLSKSIKGSSLAVMENANDSTSEMSEADEKSKSTKPPSGLANSTLAAASDSAAASGAAESASGSIVTTPTKKKTVVSKSKAAGKDVSKEGAEANKDSDKESKSGTSKKAKAKPAKSTANTPVVRVDSPPPLDDIGGGSTPPSPSRSASPSKSKSKSKVPTTAEIDSNTAEVSENNEAPETTLVQVKSEHHTSKSDSSISSTAPPTESNNDRSKSKEPKPLEPLNKEVQEAYDVVAELAKKETWEVKSRFPPHIKEPLWKCAKIALATRSTGYVLDEGFFVHLQEILPYNKFTLKKLVYKAVLPDWIIELETQRTRLIDQFATRADMVWKASGLAATEPEKDGDGDVSMNGDEAKSQKKFPWSQDLRLLLWETMEKFMEIHAAKQELRAVDESQPVPPTDSKTRKDAYQTLLQSFPAGWMTSYEISRQYSQLKEKVQKQEKKEVESSAATTHSGKPKPVFSATGVRYGSSSIIARNAASATNTSTTDKRLVTAASSISATETPQNPTAPTTSLVSPVSVASAPTSSNIDTPRDRDNTQRSSPSRSPSTAHRSAHLSEIVNPSPQPSQSRTQHIFYSESSEPTKKRKNPEEVGVQVLGSGSSHDPLFIDDQHSYDNPRERGYRQSGGSGGGAVEYGHPSSSPSKGSASQPMYSSVHTNDAAKKKRAVEQRAPTKSTTSPMAMGHPPHPSGQSTAPSSYYQDYEYPEYNDYPDHPDYQRPREPIYSQRHPHPSSPPPTYSSRQTRGYGPPPLSHGQQRHYQHHESVPPQQPQHHQQYHHRVTTRGGSPGIGGGQYVPAPHSPSLRGMQPVSSHPGTKAMSMSNLLHHPPPSHQHHPRQ